MSRKASTVVGVLLIIVGAIWFGQGIGWISGSGMSGATLWAVLGPIVALAGIALVGWGSRRESGGPGDRRPAP